VKKSYPFCVKTVFLRNALVLVMGSLFSFSAQATDYYVSVSGSDAAAGTSIQTAWKSFDKVNATTFLPGDRILLQAGGSWTGQLAPLGSGSAGSPIVIDSFGTGNLPLIEGPGTDQSAGVMLSDQSYFEVHHLEVTNQQTAGGTMRLTGINVKTTLTSGITNIAVTDCYVHDVNSLSSESNSNFSKGTGGIFFSGYTNEVLIANNHVKNVGVEGIRNSYDGYCSHFVIDNNLIENVYGDGIVLHGVGNGSAITHNTLRNVAYNTSSANYAGAWTYLSKETLVAYNEVSGITGGGSNDGQPFDADITTDGDIFEYNYTHDNAKGFMLFMPSAKNIIVRYNISVNDISATGNNKRLFNYTVTGNNNNQIYNNTFYIDAASVDYLFQGGFIGEFSNNIIYATGAVAKFASKAINANSVFKNNCFYPAAITSVNGPSGTVENTIYANPGLNGAGYHEDGIRLPALITAYSPASGAPVRTAGYAVAGAPAVDFAGNNITGYIYSSIGAIWPADLPDEVVTSITAQNDTYTFDGSPNSNYGTDTHLLSKFGGGYAPEGTSTANGYSRRTYLKFASADLNNIANINKVLVRIRYFNKDNVYSVDGTMISLSRNASWSENGITWNSQQADGGQLDSLGYTLNDSYAKPSSIPSPITDDFINSSTHYIYLDVTDTLKAMLKAGTLPSELSFVLQGICTSIDGGNSPIGNTGHSYFSKEFLNESGDAVDSLAPTLLVYSTTTPLPGGGSTYYVDPVNGNDNNSGLSQADSWKTLAKASSITLVAGDSLLLKAGSSFTGTLTPIGSGSYGYPVVISRYGQATYADPVIQGATSGTDLTAVLTLTDESYVEISHLSFSNTGSSVADGGRAGVLIENTNASVQQRHIFIDHCNFENISSGASGASGSTLIGAGVAFIGSFDSIRVTGSVFSNLGEDGIVVKLPESSTGGSSSSVRISSNQLQNIGGEAIAVSDLLSGAVLDSNTVSSVNTAAITGARAAIVIENAPKALITHTEVKAAGNLPAFYLGTGSGNTELLYNYTHGNPGGILSIASDVDGLRYGFNISQGDGHQNSLFYGPGNSATDNLIYNNTIYLGAGITTTLFSGAAVSDFRVDFENNILSLGGGSLNNFASHALNSASIFRNNSYYPVAGVTGAPNYYTVASRVLGSDPELSAPGTATDGLGSASVYSLGESSSCLSQGFNVADRAMQGIDYAGTDVSGRTFVSIGAIWPIEEPSLSLTTVLVGQDTYTYDGSSGKAVAHGAETKLVSKFGAGYASESAGSGYNRRTYLKFPTSSIASTSKIQAVYLRMRYYATDSKYSVNGIQASLSSVASWDQSTLTWNNQTSEGGSLDSIGYVLDDGLARQGTAPDPITDAFITNTSRYIYIDVTDTVMAMINKGTLPDDLSIVLQGLCSSISGPDGSMPTGNTGYTYFSSEFLNEAGDPVDSLKPSLLVYSLGTAAALPVSSSRLSALLENKAVRLNWTVYTLDNNTRYLVERSIDGVHFVDLSRVSSNGLSAVAAGNNSYLDPLNGITSGRIYYRLVQVNAAGKRISVSNITQVYLANATSDVKLYPNPVNAGGSITIELPDQNLHQAQTGANNKTLFIRIVDLSGRLVRRQSAIVAAGSRQHIQISTRGVARGMYFILLDTEDGSMENRLKLIVR